MLGSRVCFDKSVLTWVAKRLEPISCHALTDTFPYIVCSKSRIRTSRFSISHNYTYTHTHTHTYTYRHTPKHTYFKVSSDEANNVVKGIYSNVNKNINGSCLLTAWSNVSYKSIINVKIYPSSVQSHTCSGNMIQPYYI